MLTDKQVKLVLENIIASACISSGLSTSKYEAKAMGRIRRYESMKSGYYVFIQNFKNASFAKKSIGEDFYRFTFRCIQFANKDELLYEIEKWIPNYGSVDNGKIIYRSDAKKTDGMFQERMETAMLLVDYKM